MSMLTRFHDRRQRGNVDLPVLFRELVATLEPARRPTSLVALFSQCLVGVQHLAAEQRGRYHPALRGEWFGQFQADLSGLNLLSHTHRWVNELITCPHLRLETTALLQTLQASRATLQIEGDTRQQLTAQRMLIETALPHLPSPDRSAAQMLVMWLFTGSSLEMQNRWLSGVSELDEQVWMLNGRPGAPLAMYGHVQALFDRVRPGIAPLPPDLGVETPPEPNV